MSSPASSSHNNPCSAVRFVESCTLIPHCSSPGKPGLNVAMKESRVRIPSISSWSSSSRRAASDSGVAGACDTLDSSSDGVRLSLPRFRRASSSSSKSSSSAPTSPVAKSNISPILRTSSSHVPKRLRYPSLPVSAETETIPLRGCCPGCFAITEKAITDPCWVEKFSSGAQRLRGQSRLGHIHEHNHEHGVLDLSVDEVDKIRRSLDLPGADMSPGSSTARTQHLPCRFTSDLRIR
ncbi:hypothetical protein DL96DRAFT_280661 [Flagelloscypha sp. PMI_526]|nr:hypothetical protein DL96DRAFT_280661 [Flagelloscypha sp. PMI_526]